MKAKDLDAVASRYADEDWDAVIDSALPRSAVGYYQRIINELDFANDNETVRQLRARLVKIPVEDSGPKFDRWTKAFSKRVNAIRMPGRTTAKAFP